MTNMEFKIIYLDFGKRKQYYCLEIDGKTQLDEVPKGELRKIFNEMEKFCRLRFKGELQHN